jgi:hypothetical protein
MAETKLYSPDGREYVAGDQTEVTRLVARGYTEQPPKKSGAEKSEKK